MKTTTTQEQTVSILEQASNWFNPYFFEGRQVERIRFFNPTTGKEVTNQNWFGSNNDYKRIVLPFEIKRKNTIDLNSNKAFYCKSVYKYADKKNIDIYIPINFVNFKILGESLDYTTSTETRYKNTFSIEVLAMRKAHKLNELKELIYYYEEEKIQTISFYDVGRVVKNELGEQVETITEAFKKVCPNVSKYEVEAFLKIANIELI